MALVLRPMQEKDIPLGMKLKRIAGWNQTEEDWRRLLAYSPEGCFVGEVDGKPVATGTVCPYGGWFAWVGMILVLPAYRRRGIGTALIEHAIRLSDSRGLCAVRLDATPLGKKVYDRLEFTTEYELLRYEGKAPEVTGPSRPMSPEDLLFAAAFDAPVFGADRTAMLRLLYRQGGGFCFVERESSGQLTGYVMARPGERAFQIGPLVACSPAAAESLLRTVFGVLSGRDVFMDVPLVEPAARLLAESYGLTVQRPFIRMYRGTLVDRGRPGLIYATAGPETA